MSAVLAPIVASLGAVESADGTIQTEPFLTACRLVLPVFDRLGVAFAAAKSDVSGASSASRSARPTTRLCSTSAARRSTRGRMKAT